MCGNTASELCIYNHKDKDEEIILLLLQFDIPELVVYFMVEYQDHSVHVIDPNEV